ncbi:hypothetical protein [Kutzneria sp. CA-103260]|uniref:hypothetical protein n=1 Tax=Kutzneria sp. CA-103260 TaxID=2802641 RepID=UPI001BA79B74|nr:hypothetical protein [Kutzneria sp. CA-103260]QUQ72031.1 SARP family transcriptional regulator [Kutzneria sp. CA-103260]
MGQRSSDDDGDRGRPEVRNEFAGTADNVIQAGTIGAVHLHVHGRAREDDTDPLALAAKALAEAVRHQWTEEAGWRSLRRPEPLRVRWSVTDREVSADLATVLGEGDNSVLRTQGDWRDLVEVFRALPARQLVILGEPGAGKTVLALLFVLALLDNPVAGEPVPVLLSASSWNPDEHVHSWLVRRLLDEYPALGDESTYGPGAATRLVTEGWIVPVIDGLDEIPVALHVAAIDAVDRVVSGGHPLVLTCRTDEYAAAVERGGLALSRALVLEIEPVGLVEARRFLCSAGPSAPRRWRPVLAAIRAEPDVPLARALASPLMVALARKVYTPTATDPRELLDTARFASQAAVERHLLDSFVTAAYSQQPERRYRLEQAREWLRFLACHLNGLDTRDLAWWELAKAVRPRTQGLLAGLSSGLIAAAAGFVADGWIGAVAYGVGAGVAVGVGHVLGHTPRPSHAELRFRGTAKRFVARFMVGFAVHFVLGCAFGLDYAIASVTGLVGGCTLASHAWWSVPTDATKVSSPAITLRHERRAAVTFGVVLGVDFGFLAGLVYAFTPDLELDTIQAVLAGLGTATGIGILANLQYGRMAGVVYGVAAGVVSGLTAASAYGGPITNKVALGLAYGVAFASTVGYLAVLSRAWGVFQLHRSWLALRNRLPWRLTGFLVDAHRRGVLRQAGGVYQFRHARLQERLAEPEDAAPTERR